MFYIFSNGSSPIGLSYGSNWIEVLVKRGFSMKDIKASPGQNKSNVTTLCQCTSTKFYLLDKITKIKAFYSYSIIDSMVKFANLDKEKGHYSPIDKGAAASS